MEEPQVEGEAKVVHVEEVGDEQVEAITVEKTTAEEIAGIQDEGVVDSGVSTEKDGKNIIDDIRKKTPDKVVDNMGRV